MSENNFAVRIETIITVMKYQIISSSLVSSIISIMSGVRVKDLRFNTVLNVWFGTVSGVPHVWDGKGKCMDRTKPELDFFY